MRKKQTAGSVFRPYHAAVLLFSLVLLTSHLVTGLYAKYFTYGDLAYPARVAKIRYSVVNGSDAPFTYFFPLDETHNTITNRNWYCYYYHFKVNNFDTDGTSEVAFRYRVTLQLEQKPSSITFTQPSDYDERNQLYDTLPATTGAKEVQKGDRTITFEGILTAGERATHDVYVPIYVMATENGLPSGDGNHNIKYSFSYEQVD